MAITKLGAVETEFANLIWQHAPLSSGTLVQLCAQQLGWKKSTTYTVLKKLCMRGFFQNQDGIVTVRISKADYAAAQSTQFVDETFHGSLPAFLAAFTRQKPLSQTEIDEIQKMIASYEE